MAPSLSLTAWLAARSPRSRWEVFIDSRKTMTLRAFDPTDGLDPQGHPREALRETLTLLPTSVAGPTDGVPIPGEPRMARLRTLVPSDAILAQSSVRYADLFEPAVEPTTLQKAIRHRIAVIGDLRSTGERRYPYFDGRRLPAFDVTAVGIERIGQSLVSSDLAADGMAIAFSLLLLSVTGVALAQFAMPTHKKTLLGRVVIAMVAAPSLALVAAAIGWLAIARMHWLINPGPLFVAGVIAYALSASTRRLARTPLT